MRTTVTAVRTFSAAHQPLQLSETTDCSARLHGHTFVAQVVISGKVDAKVGFMPTAGVRFFEDAIRELDGEELALMLPGVHPTPEGVAHWLFERLQGLVPGLVSVSVGFDQFHATVEA